MANMREIAKAANVSVSTVSAVLSGKKYVSPALKHRVQNALELLEYDGEKSGSDFGEENREVGLIIPGVYSSFFQPLISGIEDLATQYGFNLILADSGRDWKKERYCLEKLIARGVTNLILDSVCSTDMEENYFCSELLELVEKRGVLLSVLSREINCEKICFVSLDNQRMAYEATEHLIQMGHSRIAHISGAPQFPHSEIRVQGYRMALLDHGIPFNDNWLLRGDFSPISGFSRMNELLTKGIDVTAVFSANDQMAIGAMKAIKRFGLRVPEDIAIVGFDNLSMSSLVSPGLSTVQYPIYQMGYCAMKSIIDQRMGKSAVMRHHLNARLIVRRSSDPSVPDDWDLNNW